MKDLVEVIAKSLVENPDKVVVTQKEDDRAIVVELKVAQADMGKVIGKQGRIAKAISYCPGIRDTGRIYCALDYYTK